MTRETSLERRLREYAHDPDYILAGLLWDINEAIVRSMSRKGISRAELARKLGTSPANVTQLLRGKRNLTLRSLVRIAVALGAEFAATFRPRTEAMTRGMYYEFGAVPSPQLQGYLADLPCKAGAAQDVVIIDWSSTASREPVAVPVQQADVEFL